MLRQQRPTQAGGNGSSRLAEEKQADFWQLNLFTVVQELSPWGVSSSMDILVRMDDYCGTVWPPALEG